jgi:hypothetical protein
MGGSGLPPEYGNAGEGALLDVLKADATNSGRNPAVVGLWSVIMRLERRGNAMQKEIVPALIGAIATLCATAIPLGVNAFMNRRAQHLSVRRDALLGRWEGQGCDYYVEDPTKLKVPFNAVMTFTSVEHTVKANAVLSEVESLEPDKLCLFGMFYNDDYLQLSYYNENFTRKQLGVVVLGLTSDGSTIKGYYTGFSPRRETIVAGTIVLNRKA